MIKFDPKKHNVWLAISVDSLGSKDVKPIKNALTLRIPAWVETTLPPYLSVIKK